VPIHGVYTALVTPTVGRGAVAEEPLRALLELQAKSRVAGVVVGGTTAESAALTERELARLFQIAREFLPGRVDVIAATGRNHLDGTLALTESAVAAGIETILVVDPYYIGPSSVEIRREYLEPVATRFPSLGLVPYVIPARTGTRLDPVDVARLLADGRRVVALKDATGEAPYGRELRRRCPTLPILSGDDSRTLAMMEDPEIRAVGVVSVISNLVPAAVVEMVEEALAGRWAAARRAAARIQPLADSVTIRSQETLSDGSSVEFRSRNPVPVKTAMAALGVPVGGCRPPLGRLGPAGWRMLRRTLEALWTDSPDVLRPIAEQFAVDPGARLADPALAEVLAYAEL
jgi:4-hydroxy-tetrahydrodipicolinate synthase